MTKIDMIEWGSTQYKILLNSDDTNGTMGVFEAVVPASSGPARHVHHKEDEIIFLIEGEAEFWLAGKTVIKKAGEIAFIPRGADHAFRVAEKGPARFLTIVAPGGFEGFFRTVAAFPPSTSEGQAAIHAIARNFSCEFTGPPL